MAYDEELADRIRALVASEENLTEKKMFGGLAFLIGGHMAVAASGQGGLLVRAEPEEADPLLDDPAAEPMIMRGRPMSGWLRVPASAVEDQAELERWVGIGVGYAGGLPPKR
jgi:TfoX/Sxy family transcriptional regulator of competence genes